MSTRNQTNASVQELDMARQILASIMSPSNAKFTFPFLQRIDAASIGLYKYDEIVRCPMWLQKIEEKLEQGKYPGLCEFICDFRLILVNCFLYNGVDSKMGRLCEKLEILLEQKLQLLPIDLRHKTTMQACLGCGEGRQDDDGGPMRRRASLRHYGMGGSGSSGLGSQFCPVRALMEELEHHHTVSSLGIASTNQADNIPSPSSFVTGSVLGLLYAEAGQQLPVTPANSRALLVARLTRWQRRAHEEELAAGWRDWWQANTAARERLERLRACPQFLEAFQLLWLLEPYLNIGDVMSVASRLQHDICSAFRGDSALESASLFASASSASASASQARQFSLTELELGLCGSPQTSICLAACVTALLNSPKERDIVSTALKALSTEKKPEGVNGVASTVAAVAAADILPVDSDGEDAGGSGGGGGEDNGEEKTRLLINRRVQNSHIETVKQLGAPSYDVWEGRLRDRLAQWYVEMSREKRLEDPVRLERRSGVSAAFFRVCGADKNPLEKKRFFELSIEEQAQILLSLASSVLLQNANFGFGEHLRFSMDRSADWDSTRDTCLGKDVFQGLVYLTFPEMFRSEGPRILQFALYPPTPSPEALTLATDFYTTSEASRVKEHLDITSIPLEYFLPGAVGRLPKWVEAPVAKAVQTHLLGLMESEVDALSARISSCGGKKRPVPPPLAKEIKKERGKMNALLNELAPFRAESKTKSTGKKRKSAAKEEKEKPPPPPPPPPTKPVETLEGLQLAPFGFVKRLACGRVPASAVYARQAAMSKSLKAVESYASIAESTVTTTTTTNNNSEAGTPKPAKFYQEDADDVSVQTSVDGCQTPSTIPCVGSSPDSKRESTSSSSEKQEVKPEAENNGFAAPKEEEDEEEEEEEEELDDVDDDEKDSRRKRRSKKRRADLVAAEAEYKKRAEGIAELIAKATESELDAKQHRFATVVHDLETFNAFRATVTTRLATARRLLEELTSEDPSTLRSIVEKFAAELGDGVLKKAEPLLLSEEPPKKEEAESGGLKNPKKRRRTSFLTSRTRKAPRKSKEETAAVDEEETRRAEIIRLHEEAVADLASLVEALDAMETEVAAAEEEREALERQCGLLLRKDIEARTPRPPEKPKPVPPRPPVRPLATVPKPTTITTAPAPLHHPPPPPPPPPPPHPTTTVITRTIVRPVTVNGSPVRLLPQPVGRFGVPPAMRIPAAISPIAARVPATRPFRPAAVVPGRRIFRFHGTLFTEEGLPVRVGPNGTVMYMPVESVPLSHRQQVVAMIRQFRTTSGFNSVPRM